MRSAKFFLVLGAVLTVGAISRADEVRVSGHVVFHQATATDPRQFTFSTTFLYDTDTSQLVPGTMVVNVLDTLGGPSFTDWVPKPNFHGPVFTYFDPSLDGIQLVFYPPDLAYSFPAIGSYPIDQSRLYCIANDCVQHFGGNPDVLFPVAGELSIGAVPEPQSSSLIVFGALAATILVAGKSRK
jgi:hypothetical protein